MAQQKGLAGVEVVARGRRRGVVDALAEEAPISAGLQMVPVSAVALNPDNPAARTEPGEDLEVLVASIRRIGVVSPLTLTPVADFVEAHPEHDTFGAEITYVAVAGNRRLVAARIVELDEVPAAIRPDLAALSDEAMLHENGPARINLTPIQEALGMDRLIKQGRTQSDIADALGVSQGQVAKRLQLLKLPVTLQALVESKELKLEDVPALVRAEPEVLAWIGEHPEPLTMGRYVDSYIFDAQRALQHEAAVEAAKKTAEDDQIPLVDDPEAKFRKGSADWNWDNRHTVTTKKDIEAARQAGTLVVSPGLTPDKPRFFTTEPTKQAPKKVEMPHERDARERTKSRKPRMAALLAFAAKPAPEAQVYAAAVDMVLGRDYVSSNANDIATQLGVAAGLIPEGTTFWTWSVDWQTSPDRLRIAWLAYLACAEAHVRESYHAWNAQTVAYYDLLIANGYTPGEWEQEQLAMARAQAAKEATK